jgi:hypothetical protein
VKSWFVRMLVTPVLRLFSRATADNSRRVSHFKGMRKAAYHTILRGKRILKKKK